MQLSGLPIKIKAALDNPVALNFLGDPEKRFVLLCDVCFQIGDETLIVPKGFEFDGPTIPRPLWIFAGFSPADIDLAFASCGHDFVCDNPEKLPRAIGDAIFFELLGPVTFNEHELAGVGKSRRIALAGAVVSFSLETGKDWR